MKKSNIDIEFDVLIDNGILRNTLTKNKIDASREFQSVLASELTKLGQKLSRVHFISTPIMTLEYTGKNLVPLTLQSEETKKKLVTIFKTEPFDADKIITDGVELIKSEIEKKEVSNFQHLIAECKRHNEFRCEWGKGLMQKMILTNLENKYTRYRFLYELAIDELQGFNLSEVYGIAPQDFRIQKICAALSRFLSDKVFNVATPRMVNHFYRNAGDAKLKNNLNSMDYDFRGNHQDRLDTQLVHFACLGNKRDEKVVPVLCFTCEDFDRTRNRLSAYLTYLIHLEKLGFLDSDGFRPGRVVQIWQNTGLVRDEINVVKLKEKLTIEYEAAPS